MKSGTKRDREDIRGYKIICRIEKIEETDEPGLLLETIDTIPEVEGPVKISMSKGKHEMTLLGIENFKIVPQKHVKIFARNLGSKSSTGISIVM